MIFNYIKIAVRSLRRKKFYSIIKIGSLALGLMAAMFIFQYVSLEKSYDNFHENADQTFRITTEYLTGGRQDDTDAMASAPIGPALQKEYPEVESFIRVSPEYGRTVFEFGENQFEERKLFYVDSNFFDVLSYPVIDGDIRNALKEPFSIVLTKHLSEKYFGRMELWEKSPVGEILRGNNSADFKVTAIVEDVPENTHLKFNALISFTTFPILNGDPSLEWEWNDFYTYVRLKNPIDVKDFEGKLAEFADRHLNTYLAQEYTVKYHAQSIRDIHLHSHLGYEAEANGDYRTVNFLILIAIAILIIAWANYINLATARANDRREEVGVRKVVGAQKKELIAQFMTEALIVNIIAICLALFLVYFLQPFMDELSGKNLEMMPGGLKNWFLIISIALVLGTALSGIYPSLILSGFSPVKTLKSIGKSPSGDLFRKGLVTFQYACSIILIISTIIIFSQLNYMKNTDLGFSPDNKIVVNAPATYRDSLERHLYKVFKNELLKNPEITGITASSAIPGKYYLDLDSRGGIKLLGADENTKASFTSYRIDEDYFDVYGLQIIAGIAFSDQTTADDNCFSVNEAALSLLGISSPEEAIGKKVWFQSEHRIWPIVNVFKNYHHKSPKLAHEPTILWNFIPDPDPLYYTVKFDVARADQIAPMISSIEESWVKVFPDNPFNYFFFDDQFNDQYEADSRLGKILATFALFAVFIACLGLFGLTSFMISIKTKEIGIRKVLGASISNIILLLTKDFLKLVMIALFLAIPLSLFFGVRWLENFANKTPIHWWIFVLAGCITVVIAVSTISLQSYKAAMANPTNALKDQ